MGPKSHVKRRSIVNGREFALSAVPFVRAVRLFAFLALVAGATGCVSYAPEPEQVFRMIRADSLGDTVSVFPVLKVAFTRTPADESVSITFSPLFVDYAARLSESRDTLTIRVTGLLDGETRYVLRPAGELRAGDGSVPGPDTDSLVIHTYPAEQEPNDTRKTADPFQSPMYGRIKPANDTDFFFLEAPTGGNVILESLDSKVSLEVRDSSGTLSAAPVTQNSVDTLAVSDSPVWVLAYSRGGIMDERYRLSFVAKKSGKGTGKQNK